MRFLILGMLCCILVSCEGKKEIQLPKSDVSLVKTIGEHSPIYIFFKVRGNDTVANLNRANTITSTHWVFNIDKRLPLRLVLNDIIKMQAKKDGSMHKNETSENYFSYADTLHKNLAFMPFTAISYKLEKPKQQGLIFIDKNNRIWLDGKEVDRKELKNVLTAFTEKNPQSILFCFSKECSFGTYLQNKIFIKSLDIAPYNLYKESQTEYIF